MAIGARSQSARTYLEKKMSEFPDCTLEALVMHGLRALRETLPSETELNLKNCSVAVVGKDQNFQIYEQDEVKTFLEGIEAVEPSKKTEQESTASPMEAEEQTEQGEGTDQPMEH